MLKSRIKMLDGGGQPGKQFSSIVAIIACSEFVKGCWIEAQAAATIASVGEACCSDP